MAGTRQSSGSGLKGRNPAEMGGQADAAGGIAAEPERRSAGRDQSRFTTARSAGTPRLIVRIVSAAVNEVVGLESEKQVGQVSARDGDCAGGAQAGHQRGVVLRGRGVAQSQSARATTGAGHFDGVLDGKRHAIEWAKRLAARVPFIGRPGALARLIREHFHHGIQARIYLGDTVQVRVHQFGGRHRAISHKFGLCDSRQGQNFIHGSLTVSSWFAATWVSFCLVPLGHSISIVVTVASFPSPNVNARSLAEQ